MTLSDIERIYAEQRLKDDGDSHFEKTLSKARLALKRNLDVIEHQDTEEV